MAKNLLLVLMDIVEDGPYESSVVSSYLCDGEQRIIRHR